ncbi:RNA-binding S4 domain-containing protein [Proteinivorax tanatarense]|uniref:RNA-binding S4 domain-containing protein n=1 Tax=Proteinivorax tanatarense TaxID=1260629 RepID=A0AAU7VLX0_9FIRM
MENVKITGDFIKLDQLLKFVNLVGSGGEAKLLINEGRVKVNGVVETKRGTKVKKGDKISIDEEISYSIV